MAPKPKPAPSQPPAPPPLEDLFTTLNKHIQASAFTNAVKLTDQILAIAPGDEDALRCKVVALIKDDRFDDAISAIQSSKTPPEDFHFLKAYCLYKQNKLDEALQSLQKHERNDETMLLESRILYRLGKMDACLDIYQKLQKSKIDMLGINSVAALVMAGRSSEVQGWLDSSQVKATSSFELAYNTVCSPIQRNKYTDAELLLLSGRRTGQESLMEDNWPDKDIEIELSPIVVQLGYVQQRLGRNQDAIEAYMDMIKRDMADESSTAKTISICPADNFQCFRLLYNCGYNHHYHSLCQRWLGLCEPYVTEVVPRPIHPLVGTAGRLPACFWRWLSLPWQF